MHDIARLLFEHADEDELLYAMTSVLRIPLIDMSPDVAAAFSARNPAFHPSRIKCSKLIRKSVLDEFYLRLSYMFPAVTAADPGAVPTPLSSPSGQTNIQKQPTMTLKQIAQQLNAVSPRH